MQFTDRMISELYASGFVPSESKNEYFSVNELGYKINVRTEENEDGIMSETVIVENTDGLVYQMEEYALWEDVLGLAQVMAQCDDRRSAEAVLEACFCELDNCPPANVLHPL